MDRINAQELKQVSRYSHSLKPVGSFGARQAQTKVTERRDFQQRLILVAVIEEVRQGEGSFIVVRPARPDPDQLIGILERKRTKEN
jgi:hypothetical protein